MGSSTVNDEKMIPSPSRGEGEGGGEWLIKTSPSPQSSPTGDCVIILGLSLRATEGSAAISLFSKPCEIASVVSLPRNDIVTQSPRGEEVIFQVIPYI
jgi:hypothetical protein